MKIKNNDLFKRDNNGKIRHVRLQLDSYEKSTIYTITGNTGIYNGKMIPRPIITVTEGKVKRTTLEQATLQYNSIISNYKDKGYKDSIDLGIIDLTNTNEVESKVPLKNSDQNGNKKPMLALSWDGVKDNIINKRWFGSKKIDGVRCLMYYNKGTDTIYTSSRGGQNYDIPSTYIRKFQPLLQIFKIYPDLILDGELYIHGMPLSYISGLVRLKELCDKHKALTYCIYDIVDETKPFSKRLDVLHELQMRINLCDGVVPINIVSHVEVNNREEIMKLHDQYVSEGYEGLVIRDPDQPYKCGARDQRMLKAKIFSDAEFKITGITNGLRDEDFVFNMETKEGYPFEAKPMGDRALKQWYRDNIDNLIGKLGTVKFFGYTATEHPVPNLPVFKCLRDKIDM